MTEAEWLAQLRSPKPFLKFLQGKKVGDRRLRLFAAYCCRRVWNHLTAEEQAVVEAVERYADGLLGKDGLAAARDSIGASNLAPARYAADPDRWTAAFYSAEEAKDVAVVAALRKCNAERSSAPQQLATFRDAALSGERRGQTAGLRDLFGSIVLPHVVLPPQLPPTVKSLAAAAYEHRQLPSGHLEKDRLAVLADALEEAGCEDAEILMHLRSPESHVRGCWALDLVLGKS